MIQRYIKYIHINYYAKLYKSLFCDKIYLTQVLKMGKLVWKVKWGPFTFREVPLQEMDWRDWYFTFEILHRESIYTLDSWQEDIQLDDRG